MSSGPAANGVVPTLFSKSFVLFFLAKDVVQCIRFNPRLYKTKSVSEQHMHTETKDKNMCGDICTEKRQHGKS